MFSDGHDEELFRVQGGASAWRGKKKERNVVVEITTKGNTTLHLAWLLIIRLALILVQIGSSCLCVFAQTIGWIPHLPSLSHYVRASHKLVELSAV
jgi:hypothetical protein